MMTELTDKMLETISQEPHLSGYLRTLSEERPTTKRSWLFDQESGNYKTTDQVLKDWEKVLISKLRESGDQTLELVYQFDTSQKEKWGPQGGHKSVNDWLEYVTPSFDMASTFSATAFTSDDWEQAKSLAVKELLGAGVSMLRPASYESVVDDMRARDTLDSKSGWPQHMKRNLPEVKAKALADAYSGAYQEYPGILLFRYYNKKPRPVVMTPMATNLVEGSYCQPLQSAIMKSHLGSQFFSPWEGFESVRRRVTNAYRNGKIVTASDFSSTDAHFQKQATSEVADVLVRCFQKPYQSGLRESLMHMHEMPIVIGMNNMLSGDHGVASGSNWTNFVETIFDFILGFYVHLKNKDVQSLYAIGDDMSWISTTFYGDPLKQLLDEIGSSVGQEIKAEKTTSERDWVKSLQRLFIRGYYRESTNELRGIYSTIRALKSSVFPERFHDPEDWDSDLFCMRQFMILENCVDHPLFKDFVEYICSGNRHLIPFAHKTRQELEEVQVRARHVHGLTDTYNQEKRDEALADFDSIRVAANL